MNVLLLVALFSAAEFANGVPPINFGIKSDAKEGEACGGEQGPWCDDGLKCAGQDLEDGGQGRCQKKDDNPCCFQYGFGARLIPCCLNVITCEEHDQLLEEIEEHPEQEPVGGAIGKHHFCPRDAAHAHQLLSATHISPEIDTCLDCGIMMCPSGNRAICCEASNSCKCPENCSTEETVLKKEGEECGPCFSPDTDFFCGDCEEGLDCLEDPDNKLLPDAPAKCQRQSDSLTLPSNCHRCCSPNEDEECSRILVDCSGCSIGPGEACGTIQCESGEECCQTCNDQGKLVPANECSRYCPQPLCVRAPTGCECGKQCEMLGGGSGVCQEDGQSCGQNILPPNCPEEQSPKCNNPGKSVPSPFDSCNTCRCTDDGVIEGCTKRFCFDEEEIPTILIGTTSISPYDQLLYCKDNDPNYCEENTDGEFNSCHHLYQPSCFVDGEEVKDCYGICVPKDDRCDENKPCESIGNRDSGLLASKCKNGKCVFSKSITIA